MQSAHTGNEPDYVNNGALALVLGLVAVSTAAICMVVYALVRDEVHAVNSARDATQDEPFRHLRAAQQGVLEANPAYKDRATGTVSLPIGRAMSLTLEAVRRDRALLSPWTPGATGAPAAAQPEGAGAEVTPPNEVGEGVVEAGSVLSAETKEAGAPETVHEGVDVEKKPALEPSSQTAKEPVDVPVSAPTEGQAAPATP